MATSVIIEEQVEIPGDVRSLADFRRWALSDDFPDRGRIDFIAGNVEVDMSPESIFSHGRLKVMMASRLFVHVERDDLGHLLSDRSRVSSPPADLSVEPDIVFVSHEAVDSGRVRLVPKSGPTEDYIEIEGPPDLIVEIVSDSSVGKDTRRLPAAYAKAGVREFWLADARREPLVFQIHRGRAGRRRVPAVGRVRPSLPLARRSRPPWVLEVRFGRACNVSGFTAKTRKYEIAKALRKGMDRRRLRGFVLSR